MIRQYRREIKLYEAEHAPTARSVSHHAGTRCKKKKKKKKKKKGGEDGECGFAGFYTVAFNIHLCRCSFGRVIPSRCRRICVNAEWSLL